MGKWKKATISMFFTLVLMWIITRLYMFPFIVVRSCWLESKFAAYKNIPYKYVICFRPPFILLNLSLVFLHIVWFSMFLKMGYVLARTGKTHDLSEHKEGEKDHTVKNKKQ